MHRIVGNGDKHIPPIADLHEGGTLRKIARIARLDHVARPRPAQPHLVVRTVDDEIRSLRRRIKCVITARDHEIALVFLVEIQHIVAHAVGIDAPVAEAADIKELMQAIVLAVIPPGIVVVRLGDIRKGEQIGRNFQRVMIVVRKRRIVRPEEPHIQAVLFLVVIGKDIAVLLARCGQMIEGCVLRLFQRDGGIEEHVPVARNDKGDLAPLPENDGNLAVPPDGISRGKLALIDGLPVQQDLNVRPAFRSVRALVVAVDDGLSGTRGMVQPYRRRLSRRGKALPLHGGTAALPAFRRSIPRHLGKRAALPVEIGPALKALFVRTGVAVTAARGEAVRLLIRLRAFVCIERRIVKRLFRLLLFTGTHRQYPRKQDTSCGCRRKKTFHSPPDGTAVHIRARPVSVFSFIPLCRRSSFSSQERPQ